MSSTGAVPAQRRQAVRSVTKTAFWCAHIQQRLPRGKRENSLTRIARRQCPTHLPRSKSSVQRVLGSIGLYPLSPLAMAQIPQNKRLKPHQAGSAEHRLYSHPSRAIKAGQYGSQGYPRFLVSAHTSVNRLPVGKCTSHRNVPGVQRLRATMRSASER